MAAFCSFVWFVSLIAFIVYFFKKRNARKAAGENYQENEKYLQVSKRKKIIGWVCLAAFIGAIAFPSPESKKPELTPEQIAQQQEAKAKKEEEKKQKEAEKAQKEAEEKAKKEEEARKKYEAGLNLDLGITFAEFNKNYKNYDKGFFNTYKRVMAGKIDDGTELALYSCMSEDEVVLLQNVKSDGSLIYLTVKCDLKAAGASSEKAMGKIITVIRAVQPNLSEASATIVYEKLVLKALVSDKTEVIEENVKYTATHKNDMITVIVANKGYTGDIHKENILKEEKK